MAGFFGFHEDALKLDSPYDIYSSNDGLSIIASRPLTFIGGEDFISQTRHTHNELVIERMELREDRSKLNAYIQPDYVDLSINNIKGEKGCNSKGRN